MQTRSEVLCFLFGQCARADRSAASWCPAAREYEHGACSSPAQWPLRARERRAARAQAGHCQAVARAARDGGFIATFCADAANATANLLALLEAGRGGALPRALVLAGEARARPRHPAGAMLPAGRMLRLRAHQIERRSSLSGARVREPPPLGFLCTTCHPCEAPRCVIPQRS